MKVAPEKAYSAAIVQALQDLAKLYPENKADYQWLMEDEAASQNPITVGMGLLNTYTGDYGPRKVYVATGQLYYHREGDILIFFYRCLMIFSVSQVPTISGSGLFPLREK